MCLYFDGRNRTGCDEERAELVVDRERANFCEYYALSNQAFDDKKLHKQRQAKAQLAALFGDDSLDNEQATIDQRSVSDNAHGIDKQSEETPAQAAERKLHDLLNQ